MPTLATFIAHSIRSPSQNNKARKKDIQIGKEQVKLSLFADDVILHLDCPKDSTKKLLKLINKFNKVEGCKINIQKSVFLYTNYKLSEIPFIIHQKE